MTDTNINSLIDDINEDKSINLSIRENFKNILSNLLKNKDVSSYIKKNKIKVNSKKFIEDIENTVYQWAYSRYTSKNLTNINQGNINNMIENIYKTKSFQIYCNLNPNEYINNTYLIYEILNNNIQINDLCSLTPQELFPSKWEKLLNKKKEMDNIRYSEKEETTTDEYKCGRCHQRKCTYYLRQTRAADESMTTFITCTNCGNHWKM